MLGLVSSSWRLVFSHWSLPPRRLALCLYGCLHCCFASSSSSSSSSSFRTYSVVECCVDVGGARGGEAGRGSGLAPCCCCLSNSRSPLLAGQCHLSVPLPVLPLEKVVLSAPSRLHYPSVPSPLPLFLHSLSSLSAVCPNLSRPLGPPSLVTPPFGPPTLRPAPPPLISLSSSSV